MARGRQESKSELELRPAHLRALLSLAEARRLTAFLSETHGPGYLWPGFRFSDTPVVFFRGSVEAFLIQHPDPPAEYRLLRLPIPGLEDVPLYYHKGPLPYLPAVGPVAIEGRLVATLPLSFFRAEAAPEALVAGAIHEAYHASSAGLRMSSPEMAVMSKYPELSPINNALGNLEGRILHEYLAARFGAGAPAADGRVDPPSASETAFAFSLIRRERRGPLEDDVVGYERALEASEGYARYVQIKVLIGAAPRRPGMAGKEDGDRVFYQPGPAFQALAGRQVFSLAWSLVAEQLSRLPELNIEAAGATWWRFFHSGMAAALLADDVDPSWKVKVRKGLPLDHILEEGVVYDGGTGDERTLEVLKERYGFDDRLDAEHEFRREEKRRKEELLATLLRGSGTRITFDVSALMPEETWLESGRITMSWDPASVENITQSVRVHRHGLRFAGFGTEIRFGDLPVVEDLKNRLFHVSLGEDARLGFEGDGRACELDRPAQFDDGLELRLPGVAAIAKSGFVQNANGTLYIKIAR